MELLPALKINIGDPIFIADFFGFVLALPVALFMAFWMSMVKDRKVVVMGAFIGALVGFLGILAWVDTLIYNTPLPDASIAAVLFGSILICSVGGSAIAIIADLVIARRTSRYYRRPQQSAHQ